LETLSSLVFIGFMGAGKTSAARAAGAALGARAVDSDHVLEERLGCSIEDYFAAHGERAFRSAEEEAVCELLEHPPSPVLSLGGGAIASERVRSLPAGHTVVLLDVDEETAWRRAGGRRPLARDRSRFASLLAERAPLYDTLADAVLLDSSREVVGRAAPVLRGLAGAPEGTKLVWATAASGDYPVYVGDGLLGSGFAALEGAGHVVTDRTVGALYGDAVEGVRVQIEPGETAKTLETAGWVLERLAEAGLDHDGHVIALGGGVVGDLAGFCAAVYQRGVRVV
jgi:shikimate kinase / 3-dehydroquinate synthase